MFKLILLFIFVLSIVLLSFVLSKGSLFSPQILFALGFLLSAGYAFFYVQEMQLSFSADTMLVLFLGIFLFFAISLVCQRNDRYEKTYYFDTGTLEGLESEIRGKAINVEYWKQIVFLALNCAAILLFIRYLMIFSHKSSISEAMWYFDNAKKFTDVNVDVPALVSLLRMTSSAIAYICIYLLSHQLIYGYYSNRIFIYINIFTSGVCSALTGSRGGILEYGFAFVVMCYFIFKRKYRWKKRIPPRVVALIIISIVMIIPVFYMSAFIMGRGKQTDVFHYLCIYLSGSLKNLDIFIRKGIFGADISESQTLVNLRLTILPQLGLSGWDTKLNLPFNNINGFSTGNVYTIFYMFMYDGGYFALFVYLIAMALIASALYLFVIKNRYDKFYDSINIPLIIYIQIGYAVLFSFFSDKFYELILDLGFWRKNIIIIILVWFCLRFKFIKSSETHTVITTKRYTLFRRTYYIGRSE